MTVRGGVGGWIPNLLDHQSSNTETLSPSKSGCSWWQARGNKHRISKAAGLSWLPSQGSAARQAPPCCRLAANIVTVHGEGTAVQNLRALMQPKTLLGWLLVKASRLHHLAAYSAPWKAIISKKVQNRLSQTGVYRRSVSVSC